MEALAVLEKKITDLVDLVNTVRAENVRLTEKNDVLKKKVEDLESSSLEHTKESVQEREITKLMVDSSIHDIDAVVGREQ